MKATLCASRGRYLLLGLLLGPALLLAGEPRTAKTAANKQPAAEEVELFAALDAGDVNAKFIPRNDKAARLMLTNNTGRPLNVRLPEAFAGMPVLAQQFGGGGFGGGGQGGQGGFGGGQQGGGQQQAVGGGMGGMGGGGMGGGMGGMGGGMGAGFNVADRQAQVTLPVDKTVHIKLTTVCLEHGKKNPRAGIPYTIRPIQNFSTKPEVAELLRLLGENRTSQRVAQVAAWHFANGMSWEELAAKRIKHLNGTSEPYFSLAEVRAAMQLGEVVVANAKHYEQISPPTVTSSASTR